MKSINQILIEDKELLSNVSDERLYRFLFNFSYVNGSIVYSYDAYGILFCPSYEFIDDWNECVSPGCALNEIKRLREFEYEGPDCEILEGKYYSYVNNRIFFMEKIIDEFKKDKNLSFIITLESHVVECCAYPVCAGNMEWR